ncbi:MAG: hypothetical protein WCY34_06605, partial [Candidatus Omnitrophota bacterium]
ILFSTPSSWMLTAKVIKTIGLFDEQMRNWEDGDYLVRLASVYPVYFINENLVIWHTPQEHANVISLELLLGKERFLKNNFELIKKDKDYLFKFYRALGKDALCVDNDLARKYLFKAFLIKPGDFSTISKLIKSIYKQKTPSSRGFL